MMPSTLSITRRTFHALVFGIGVAGGFVGPLANAQGLSSGRPLGQIHQPSSLRSEPAALRQYEAGQVRALQERCKKERTTTWSSWEQQETQSGWVLQTRRTEHTAAYVRVNLEKKEAVWVDHQSLDGGMRLHLKLALPRDYARCRVVEADSGEIRLEVAHRSQLQDGRVKTAYLRLSEVERTAVSCSQRNSSLVIVRSGEGGAWPMCTDAQKMADSQVRHLTHELFGEPVPMTLR